MLFKHFIQEREVAIRRHSFFKNPSKLSAKKLICNEVERCQAVSLQNHSFTHPFSCTALIFSECITITSSKEALKVVLLVIYLSNHDSYKSMFFMLNLTFSWVKFLSNNTLEFFVSFNIKIARTSFLLLCVLICFFFYKNLIALHHGGNNFLFWHLYQIYTFYNISKMKEWQHVIWRV